MSKRLLIKGSKKSYLQMNFEKDFNIIINQLPPNGWNIAIMALNVL